MIQEDNLNRRAREILQSVIRTYIETGEPVGSRTLSRQRDDSLSPASIRNAMADLCDEGYLSQPHTSAGRIPTDKAFRFYVRSLAAGRLGAAEAELVRNEIESLDSVDARIERSPHILTELTRNVGIAAALPSTAQVLDQVELLLLPDGTVKPRVLMILVTRDRQVRNRVVVMEEPVTQDELISIRNYVNTNFGGWTLRDARAELLRRIDLERAAYDALLRKLSLLHSKGLLDVSESADVHVDGASNLIAVDLNFTRERIRSILRTLEEKQRLLLMLDEFLESTEGVQVRVGLGEAHPELSDLALIGLSVNLPSGGTAKLAVLGPMRMHYEKVMGAVLHLGKTIQTVS